MQRQEKFYLNEDSVADAVQQWGNATSIALLDQSCHIFSSPISAGIIGYRLSRKSAVVLGDPVCPQEAMPNLVDTFNAYCQKQGKSIVHVAASHRFTQWALEHSLRSAIEIGHEIILDPRTDLLAGKGSDARRLRNKYNQSIKANIMVKEYRDYDYLVEQAIEQVGAKWLGGRRGPQIYLHQLNIFSGRKNKRWFYAEQNGLIIGVIVLNRIDAYHGWVINMVMKVPEAPRVTSEYMILSVLRRLQAEECQFLSAGTVAATQLGRIENLGAFSTWLVRSVYKVSKKVFQLGDRQRYWKKFQPRKESSYILFSKKNMGLSEIYGIMRAMNVAG